MFVEHHKLAIPAYQSIGQIPMSHSATDDSGSVTDTDGTNLK